MTPRLTIKYTLRADFRVGTGQGEGRTVDATLLRDEFGRVLVPATQGKGLLRDNFDRLIAMVPIAPGPICAGDAFDGPHLATVQRYGVEFSGLCSSKAPCIRCRLFGSTRTPAQWAFEDWMPHDYIADGRFSPSADRPRLERAIRGSAKRDRQTGRAEDKSLRSVEFAPATTLVTSVTRVAPGDDPWTETVAMACAARLVEGVGAKRRRGAGEGVSSVEVSGLADNVLTLGVEDGGDDLLTCAREHVDFVDAIMEAAQ